LCAVELRSRLSILLECNHLRPFARITSHPLYTSGDKTASAMLETFVASLISSIAADISRFTSFAAGQKRRFAQETPKEHRFSNTDLAKYLNAWEGQAHQVSFGIRRTFSSFGYEPDAAWFKAFVAEAILFRATLSIVRAKKFAAFQANIVAYTIACLSRACGGRIDFDIIWTRQVISPELHKLLESWVGKIDKALRKTADNRMVSEWAKKNECHDSLRELTFDLPEKLLPELFSQASSVVRGSTRSKIRNHEVRL
jgi:hypothetical protein